MVFTLGCRDVSQQQSLTHCRHFFSAFLSLQDASEFVFVLQDSIGLLLDAVRTSNEDLAQTWKKSEQWATIEQLCSKSPPISQLKVSTSNRAQPPGGNIFMQDV